MARLQILELPEGSGDDRPPFILVVDQVDGDAAEAIANAGLTTAELIGARAVLVFEDTIDIPANDTTAYLQQVAEETGATIGKITSAYTAQTLADERTDITRDMYRLVKWRQELTNALGMDRLRDWDDIRNAAAALRKERDAQAAAIERVRDRHRPVEHGGQTICWECSAYDLLGKTTDNPPVTHDQCGTLKALAGYPAADA